MIVAQEVVVFGPQDTLGVQYDVQRGRRKRSEPGRNHEQVAHQQLPLLDLES